MSLTNARDGAPPTIPTGNGTPQGPRVRKPGYSGWWLHAPDGSLVPDGHVEPVDPNARRAKHRPASDMAAPRPRCRYGHGPEDQTTNSQGYAVCRACARAAGKRSRERSKAA